MAFGFPAYHKDRRNIVLSKEKTKEIAIKALENISCKEIGLHPFALDYKTTGGMLMNGERIYVNITDSEIIIRSECLFPTRVIDFGKNKSNIELFWIEYDLLMTSYEA